MHKQNDDVRIHLLDASSNTLFSNLLISEKDKIESLSLSSNQIVKIGNSRVAKITFFHYPRIYLGTHPFSEWKYQPDQRSFATIGEIFKSF